MDIETRNTLCCDYLFWAFDFTGYTTVFIHKHWNVQARMDVIQWIPSAQVEERRTGLCGGARGDDYRNALVGLGFCKLSCNHVVGGVVIRSGIVISVCTIQHGAVIVRFDDSPTKMIRTDLLEKKQRPHDALLIERGEWRLQQDRTLTPVRDLQGVLLGGATCGTCLFASDKPHCPICTHNDGFSGRYVLRSADKDDHSSRKRSCAIETKRDLSTALQTSVGQNGTAALRLPGGGPTDNYVSGSEHEDAQLRKIVAKNSLHTCNPQCLNKNGMWKKHFPQKYTSFTHVPEESSRPIVRRRATTEKDGFSITTMRDNKQVEYTNADVGWHSIKYIFKYVYKGLRLRGGGPTDNYVSGSEHEDAPLRAPRLRPFPGVLDEDAPLRAPRLRSFPGVLAYAHENSLAMPALLTVTVSDTSLLTNAAVALPCTSEGEILLHGAPTVTRRALTGAFFDLNTVSDEETAQDNFEHHPTRGGMELLSSSSDEEKDAKKAVRRKQQDEQNDKSRKAMRISLKY